MTRCIGLYSTEVGDLVHHRVRKLPSAHAKEMRETCGSASAHLLEAFRAVRRRKYEKQMRFRAGPQLCRNRPGIESMVRRWPGECGASH